MVDISTIIYKNYSLQGSLAVITISIFKNIKKQNRVQSYWKRFLHEFRTLLLRMLSRLQSRKEVNNH